MRESLQHFLKQFKEPYEVVAEFPVLHEGWEMDNKGWVVSIGESRKIIVLTNHNSPYEATEAELVERINFYGKVIDSTLLAINISKGV